MPNENDIENTNSNVETNTNSDNEQPTSDATDATSSDNSSDNTNTNDTIETNPELDDFKKYAKIDYDDDDSLIQIFLVAAKDYIQKATGQIYDDTKELHHLLKNLLALHFYENRQSVNASSINEIPFTIQNLLTFIQSTSDSTYELQEKEVVPTDVIQEVVADPEYFGLSKVTVQAVNLQNLTISQNGEYEAGEEYSGLGKIIVNVLPKLEDKFITENGIYYPPEGKDGYRNISVNVQASPTLIDKTFTENGTYTPETNTDGYRNVTVNVEQPAEPVLENLTVKSTNTEQIIQPSTGVDGFDKVVVQKINLQDKSVNPSTSSQTIQADSAYDGLNQVNISAIQTEQKTVKSNQNPQVIYPTSGKFINQITVEANTLQSKAVTPTTSAQTVQADSSYYGLDHVNISAIQTENKTVKSTDISQVIYPTSGKFINQITVSPIDLESKIVKSTETQQTINPTTGKDGINQITVSPIIAEDITTKSTTTQQVINPTSGKDYIKSVTVEPMELETKTVKSTTTQQTIQPTAGKDGISEIIVEALELETKTITQNGTYTPTTGKDGFSEVTVNVSGEEEPDLLYTYRNKSVITAEDLAGFTEIPDRMFYSDSNLISIDIPEGVKSIGEYAFSGCSRLCHVELPSTLRSIKGGAFSNCSSLYELHIPDSCALNGYQCIVGTKIKKIDLYYGYGGAYNEGSLSGASNIESVFIKSDFVNFSYQFPINSFYELDFSGATNLTTISNKLFSNGNANILSIYLPDSVTTLVGQVFYGCSGIEEFSLPSGITTFSGSNPFYGCSNLEKIYVRGNSSCSTANTLSGLTPSDYNNAEIIYTVSE